MNRNLGVYILIVCFGCSNVNLAWATEVMQVSPIVVQPYEVDQLNQQMLNRDRQNRDEEIAIQNLIEENNKLIQSTLAHQQDEGLAQVDQTMLNYRQSLYSRDQARIEANSEKWSSRYGDLIALTEEVDNMTSVHSDMEHKSGALAEKYQMLTALKNEMEALNEKLRNEEGDSAQKEGIIEGYKSVTQQQQDKIKMLVDRLDEMDQKISHFDEIIAEKDRQIAQLKDNLAMVQSEVSSKEVTIRDQENQINILQQRPTTNNYADLRVKILSLKTQIQGQINDLKIKDGLLRNEENRMLMLRKRQMTVAAPVIVNKYNPVNARMQAEMMDLKNKIRQQAIDLKAKNDSINWLNQVLAATKNKAEYYRLTAEHNQMTGQQVKDYKQLENDIVSLKAEVISLNQQLAQKQEQVDLLKSELETKIAQINQTQQELQAQQDLKAQLQDKEDQIVKMKANVQTILHNQANLEERVRLAKQLIVLQQQQTALLGEKNGLKAAQSAFFDEQALDLEGKIRGLIEIKELAAKRRLRMEELNNQLSQTQQQVDDLNAELRDKTAQVKNQAVLEYMIRDLRAQLQDKEDKIATLKADIRSGQETQAQVDTLKSELDQKEQQVQSLNAELKDKIAQEKNQGVLEYQIKGLNTQLQEQENRIEALKVKIQAGRDTQVQEDLIKQQLTDQQNKMDLLKQELDNKNTQYNQMTVIISDYQKKLESRNNDYNQQLQQVLLSKNGQVQMQGQVDDLSTRLQQKEAEIVRIKKEMYDMQESDSAKDRDLQAKDLSLSMVQQKMMSEKAMNEKISDYQERINELQATDDKQAQEVTGLKTELALARQQLNGMPSSDEITYLKTGLKQATLELKQKDDMLAQVKTNSDEYSKEFKDQSQEFQSLKVQLQDALAAVDRKNEDLKYNGMALTRLKERSLAKENDLEAQVKALTRELKVAQKGLPSEVDTDKVEALEAQLKDADAQIKDLQDQLSQSNQSNTVPVAQDAVPSERLKQALNKIDEQDKTINELTQQLKGKTNDNNAQVLQTELNIANARIKNMQDHLKEMNQLPKGDRLQEKLKQALDEIDEQGRVVNLLVDKLHQLGESVNLSQYFAKP